ncbi:MAG: hypothetical protein OEY14_14560, partial [Myxococcales bacterium]|nr:hypothetical protein [Myxococcales bacterium]
IDLIGAWPGPLSLLLRTAEGQRLTPEVRVALASALGHLGTAYVRVGKLEWAEEVMRLGIQWGQDGPAAGDLFRRLGEACVVGERSGEAIGLLRRALALEAPERDVLPLLARSYIDRGKFVAAAVCMERATALGLSSSELAEGALAIEEALGQAWTRFRGACPDPGERIG